MINIDALNDDEKLAALESIHKSIAESKEIQKKKITTNVELIVKALKKIESDLKQRYDETGQLIANLKNGEDGRDGKDGKDGKNGRDGRDGPVGPRGYDGLPGRNGIDGADGVSVTDAHIDFDGSLIISLSSGRVINVGEVVAADIAEKIKVITNGGGTSQGVLDAIASLQAQIDSIASGLEYQGTWNATTNVPTLASSVGTAGYYYIVATAGSTNLNGVTDWQIGDWAVFNGSVWQKIDQTNLVTSVAGRTGAVTLSTSDISGLGTIATQAANNVSITGGSITGITDLAIADGGTGASTAANARTNLGLVIGTDVLSPTGSAASLTSFPTFNQNTTGTAANVTGTVAIANGGTGATTAGAARTALGATTVGANVFTLTNPSAITFPRFNADNTVSALDAATFRTAIGAGTSSTTGTVTSVAASVPSFLSIGGSPITSSGTLAITLSGTALPTTSGGTGLTSFTANGVVYASSTSALTTGSSLTFDGTTFISKSNAEFGNSLVDANRFVNVIGAGTNKDFGIQFTGSRVLWQNTGQSGLLFGVSDAEQMRLTSTGLGIGTTSPAYKLDVVGTAGISGNVTLSGGTANGVAYLNGSKVVTSGSALTFDGTSLGIGASPTFYQGSGLLITRSGFATIRLNDSSAGGTAAEIKQSDSTGLILESISNRPIQFNVNASEQMRLTSTGLGIGTSSPSQKLDVNGNITSTAWIGRGNGSAPSADCAIYRATDNTLGFSTASTERMRLDSSGNLGIGTSSPLSKLDVRAASATMGNYQTIQAFSTDATAINLGGGISLGGNYSGSSTLAQFASIAGRKENATDGNYAGYLQFGTNSQATGVREVMRLDSSGNLGLGVTPSAWGSNWKATQSGVTGAFASTGAGSTVPTAMVLGAYNDNTNWKYQYTSVSSARYEMTGANAGSTHAWYISAGGTAGNAITFTQALTLEAGGNLLLGATSISGAGQLRVFNGSTFRATDYYNASPCITAYSATDTTGGIYLDIQNSAFTRIGSISRGSSTTVLYNTSSDYRLKNITGSITTSGAYIDSLNPVEGTWKADGSTFVGLIAHEVQEASRTQVTTGTKDGAEMQAMDYSNSELIANLIAEVKSLRQRVATLEAK